MINYLKITFGILIVLSASRFIPHPPNFTALIALSFYIPALLGKKYIPSLLGCFILTDLFLNTSNNLIYMGQYHFNWIYL